MKKEKEREKIREKKERMNEIVRKKEKREREEKKKERESHLDPLTFVYTCVVNIALSFSRQLFSSTEYLPPDAFHIRYLHLYP